MSSGVRAPVSGTSSSSRPPRVVLLESSRLVGNVSHALFEGNRDIVRSGEDFKAQIESTLRVGCCPVDPTPEPDKPETSPADEQTAILVNRPGFGVQDLPNPGVAASIRRAIALLPAGQSRLLVAAAAIQVSLGLLDLLGIALVGLLAAIAVTSVGVSGLPTQVDSLLNLVGMGGLTLTQKTIIVAIAAVTVLVGKTALSALMAGRILRFLANRQADVSVRLARDFLSRPLIDVQRWTTSEAIYALGGGVGASSAKCPRATHRS